MNISDNIIGFFKSRRQPTHEPVWSNPRRNVRDIEPIYYNDVPDPTRDSLFNDRDAKWPFAILGVNIADWESNMATEFGYPIYDGPQHNAEFLMGRGGQLPWEERVNIASPEYVPYGSQMELNVSPEYYPLMGA